MVMTLLYFGWILLDPWYALDLATMDPTSTCDSIHTLCSHPKLFCAVVDLVEVEDIL